MAKGSTQRTMLATPRRASSIVLVIIIVVLRLGDAMAGATERDRAGITCVMRCKAPTPAGSRCDLVAGHRGRLADDAAARAPHQVDVNVIVVIGVGAGRKHGGELLARRALDVAQEALLFRHAVPTVLHSDAAAIGERKRGDVER